MNYYQKYLKYKNKYLQLQQFHTHIHTYSQSGGDKPFITDINSINLFVGSGMEHMETHLNPIYGLYMCSSGFITNNYYLNKENIINTPVSNLIFEISKEIPGSIQPKNKIIENIKPIDFGRYIAIKYIFKFNQDFIRVSASGGIKFFSFVQKNKQNQQSKYKKYVNHQYRQGTERRRG